MDSVRFIHVADLHLDSPFKGLRSLPEEIFKKVQESTFVSFKKIIDIALAEEVDFLLIAGDVYDGANRSLVAQARFKKEIERLQACHIPVYLIHGNHDHLAGTWAPLDWPDNLFLFPGEIEQKLLRKGQKSVRIYGYSYPERNVKENIARQFPKREGTDYHIGLLHGQMEGNSDHANYAPFALKDLEEKDFDYWALGHIHQRQQITSNIFYPGNIQGRNKKENGEKGCNFVTLDEGGAQVQFIETAPIRWESIMLDVTEIQTIQQLMTRVEEIKEEVRHSAQGHFLTIILSGSSNAEFLIQEELVEMLQVFNENEVAFESFVWVVSFENKTVSHANRAILRNEPNFLGDIVRLVDTYIENSEELQASLSELFIHPKARRYLHPFTSEELKEIVKEAETNLMTMLREEGRD